MPEPPAETAPCTRCGHPAAPVEVRDGRRVIGSHTAFGSTVACYRGAGQPAPPLRGAR